MLRVNLRRPLSWRVLPGTLIPLVNLVSMVVVVAGLATASREGVARSLVGLTVFTALTLARAVQMLRHRVDRGIRTAAGVLAIAGVFHMARALALVVRANHRHRRR